MCGLDDSYDPDLRLAARKLCGSTPRILYCFAQSREQVPGLIERLQAYAPEGGRKRIEELRVRSEPVAGQTPVHRYLSFVDQAARLGADNAPVITNLDDYFVDCYRASGAPPGIGENDFGTHLLNFYREEIHSRLNGPLGLVLLKGRGTAERLHRTDVYTWKLGGVWLCELGLE